MNRSSSCNQRCNVRTEILLHAPLAQALTHSLAKSKRSPATKDTFATVADKFVVYQRARLTPKAFERESGIVRLHLKPFFNCDIAAIRRLDIQKYVTHRSGKASPHPVAKELTVLKHLLRMACEWEIIPVSPADRIKGVPVPAGRVRYLQPAELKLLIDACPQWLQPIVTFCLEHRCPPW